MSGNPEASPRPQRIAGFLGAVLTVATFAFLFLLMLSLGLRRGVNHDESEHVAAGAVLARDHLLPYRDYPYFHMPDLVLIYGFLFHWCGRLVLTARVLSVTAGWLTVLLLWLIVRRECQAKSWAARWLLPAGAALLLVGNPIFHETFWRTGNHAVGTLFGVAAIAFAMRPGRGWSWFLAGLFLGLAIGTRLTFAPLGPLVLAPLCEPSGGELRKRARQAAICCCGAVLSLLPTWIVFAMAPTQFLFGNFISNSRINRLFRQSYHDPRVPLRVKLLFPFTTLLHNHANLMLALLFALFVAAALVRLSKMQPGARYRLLLVLGLIPFALIGAIAPSPSQVEYYYALMPLIVLAIALSAADFSGKRSAWICALLLLAPGAFAMSRAWDEYQRLAILRKPSMWPAVMIHEAGIEVSQLAHGGRVLTLAPLFALEGGLDIYHPLVTGGIAWRIEPFVTPKEREEDQVLGPGNFGVTLDQTPPAAVLTSLWPGLDGPLIAWVKAHRFTPHLLKARGKLLDRATVWTPP